MNRLQVVKKYIAIAVLAVMLAVPMLLPRTVAWAEDTAAPTKAQLHMDYLGLAGNAGSVGPKTEPQTKPGFDIKDLDTTKIFWVGVRVSDLTAAGFLKDGGAHDLEIAIEYDPDYVVPCDSFSSPTKKVDNINATGWAEIVAQYNFAEGDSKYTWNSNYYSMATGSAPTARPIESEGRENEIVSGWRTQYVLITKTADVSNAATNRFYNVNDNDDYYIIRLPFVLKDAPAADVTAKPDVMRMALGPVSFVMTSGVGGTATDTQTYAWEATTRTDDTHNLKTYFDYYGDLNIFTAADSDTLTSLTVEYKTTDEGDKEVTETAQFYKDKEQANKISFDTGVKEYYIEVPFDTDKLTVNMAQLTAAPVVERYDFGADTDTATIDKVTPTENASVKGKWSAEVALSGTGEDDYKDTVRITVNSESESPTVYLIHVKRVNDEPAGEAKIILNPGNSPYGEIMKDDTVWKTYTFTGENADYNTKSDEEKKAKWQDLAKASFTANNAFVDEALTPVSMTSQRTNEIKYALTAWLSKAEFKDTSDEGKALRVDPTRNMDMNEEAIFVYNREAFVDPGFEAYDSKGNSVSVKREITVKRVVDTSITYTSFVDSNVADDTITIISDDANYLIDELKTGNYIRPDVYEMKYSFVDGDETITAVRKVIVLAKAGDSDTDNEVGVNDVIYINQFTSSGGEVADSLTGFVRGTDIADSAYRVFSYRAMDSFYDGEIDTNDLIAINQFASSGGEGVATPLPVFYAKLPSAK